MWSGTRGPGLSDDCAARLPEGPRYHRPHACVARSVGRLMPASESACDRGWVHLLANEAETLKSDPRFAVEIRSAAAGRAIPLPAAVVSHRTCSAVARCGSDFVASGGLRQAAALLAGHEARHRLRGARWRTERATTVAGNCTSFARCNYLCQIHPV